jgi:hypothetical protein
MTFTGCALCRLSSNQRTPSFNHLPGKKWDHCDGRFDWIQFEQDRREERDWQVVRAIAEGIMPTRDLGANPELKAALLAAYRAGKRV